MPTASSRSSAPSLRRAALALALCLGGAAQAEEPQPVIREIVFRGNDVTQPVTMLREMSVHVGDPADPREVERSRQGVQDLGLFRSVVASLEPVEGGVRLVIKVKEKYYVLPLPRADASSDGGYAYGAQLNWYNVWGLNHTFRPYFERRQPSEGKNDPEKRGEQTRAQARYSAPFVYEKFGLDLAYGYFKTPYLTPLEYEQTTTFYSANLTRKFTGGHGSQGWTGVGGLTLANEKHTGAQAPTDPLERARGQALALTVGAYYRDLHFNVYSDDGVAYGLDVQSATDQIASDYNVTSWGLSWYRYLPVQFGDAPHQNLNLQLDLRSRHDGRYGGDYFAIGGVETVRGFEPETKKGDAYYAASIEYLHPVFRNSIRALFVLDGANAFADANDMNLDKVYVSAGVGVRLRIQAFVALDLELGWAWPLGGGPPRVFASKV
jgi:outer membrane protein assembly factor BamA